MNNIKDYLTQQFQVTFQEDATNYLSCGSRFEVLGNHTDHNRGLCIAATCNLSVFGAFAKRSDKIVRFLSEGFGYTEIDLSDLNKVDDEQGKSAALIRGIARYLFDNGFVIKGFNAYFKSEIPAGAGVSSSAAFELLVAQVFNAFYNESKIPLMILCKASQYAEREYYGKMCGLLDQIGVSHGGLTFIDFQDVANPLVKPLEVNFDGYQFVIVNSGGSHAELSDLYKAIPDQMFEVAGVFQKSYLRDLSYEQLKENKADVIAKTSKQAYQKAVHFYEENMRAEKAIKALEKNNIEKLIDLINKSRESSTDLLENMYYGKIKGSPLEACNLIMKASHQKAGVKINGGGFAGSVIALVPDDQLDNVVKAAKEKYGKENVYLVSVRNEIPSEF